MCVAGGTWHRGVVTGSHPAQSCSKKDTAGPHNSPQLQPGHPQIGSRLVVFMVISQLSYVQDAAVFGCPCQHRGRIVPVQHPPLAHSQRKNEMSGTGPQPGCASQPCVPVWNEHSHQPATSSAAGSTTSLLVPPKWECPCGAQVVSTLLCSCLPQEEHGEVPSQVPRATKLVPHAGQGCSNSRFKAAVWGGDTSAKQPHALARDGGKQGHPLQLVLHPSSLPQHSQTLPNPHRLLQEILLFSGMFLSKIALIGIRKKKKKKRNWIKNNNPRSCWS